MPARILITTTVPETLATILKGQPRFLSKHFDVELVTSPGQFVDVVAQNEGLPVHPVPMARGINILQDFLSLMRMIMVMRVTRPVLVHSYTPKAGLITMLAAALCRVPVRVHTFTGLIFPTERGVKRKLLVFIDRLICTCATVAVPEGRGVKNDLEKFGVTRKSLTVIGSGNIAGVDTTYFAPSALGVSEDVLQLRRDLGLKPGAFVFCFVGRLNKDKGLDELLQAFQQLPTTAHLVITGDLDRSAPVGQAVIAFIESNPRVHSVGFRSDVRSVLGAADILVLPSYREGFPNVLLEAGAMGLPVIASDINGCNEVVEPNFNGWLVPPRDADALTLAMRRAMHTSRPLLRQMGRRARNRIADRFERRDHWQRLVKFYEDLLPAAQRLQITTRQRFLVVGGYSDSLLNFRGAFLEALVLLGLDVHVAAPNLPPGNSVRVQLERMGVTVHDVPIERTRTNPLVDLVTFWSLTVLMRRLRPHFTLAYTIKPVIYGSVAGRLAGVPKRYALVTGLGYAFGRENQLGGLRSLVKNLYALALSQVQLTFFQNPDDLALFRELGILKKGKPSCLVNGSGVDLSRFSETPIPPGPVRFLLIARLLVSKGVREYVHAARYLKKRYPESRFMLAGWIDSNPDAIPQSELDGWVADGSIEYLGRLPDVRPALEDCSVYVLPSYREGTPRSVLEAMAIGRPVITSNAPGCRETVIDGESGFLVPAKSVDGLVVAMERFIDHPELTARMGARGRRLAEEKYDVHKVNSAMLLAMGIR